MKVDHQSETVTFRYLKLAREIEGKISSGQYKAGEKLPSLRNLHTQTGLSITTILQTYGELEVRGLVEPRQKSGYFVRPLIKNLLPLPGISKYVGKPRKVYVNSFAEALQSAIKDKNIFHFGAALPATQLLPIKQLQKSTKTVTGKYFKSNGLNYGPPAGTLELKRQIAGRMIGYGNFVKEEEIIITHGCLDAIQLCLRAITNPGDIVVTESPTFTCYLQLIEDLGLMALEIPTSPTTGIDLIALENALCENTVSACLLNPNFQNPLGFTMSSGNKEQLVDITNSHQVPIIEDDIYSDLYFSNSRPSTIKSHDKNGMVLYCSSFSKTLAPDLRIGWVLPGKFLSKVSRMQFNSSIAPPKLNQLILADFLQNGYFDRHLRKFRVALQNQVSNTAMAIARHFPLGTKLTAPDGGFILWVELDKSVDSFDIYHKAKEKKISILPGKLGSSTEKFNNCLRISCGHPWNEKLDNGIKNLGEIVAKIQRN